MEKYPNAVYWQRKISAIDCRRNILLPMSSASSPLFWNRSGAIALVGVLITLLWVLLMRQMPELDVAVSRLFFTVKECAAGSVAEICGKFDFAHDEFWRSVRGFGHFLPRLIMGILIIAMLVLCFGDTNKTPQAVSKAFFGLGSLLVGPVIITNLILKEYWGRPRPYQTDMFAGDAPFVLPGTISNHCAQNCSFVSGEATAAFWLLWIVVLVPKKWRWPVGLIIGLFAIGVSFLRVVFGRHYFSDVTTGGLVALSSIAVVAWLLQTDVVQAKIKRLTAYTNGWAWNIVGNILRR